MNVSLTSDLSEFVAEQLQHGGYNNQSEVIREGLRLLRSRKEKLLRLQSDIQAGIADVENGETKPLTEELLLKIASRAQDRLIRDRGPADRI